ncbi:MAG: MarR family winged helix-turn-helix transcriptional regulator [Dermatophilaceae bacterium]
MAEESSTRDVEARERGRMNAEELSWALRAVVLASAEVDRALARSLELRPLDYTAVNHAMTTPHPIGPAELSERLGISTGSATELVDRLETAGHLRRDRHPTDRRRVTLTPTDTAIDQILTTLRPLFDDLDALTHNFTPDEQDTIRRFLRAAEHRLHNYAQQPPQP